MLSRYASIGDTNKQTNDDRDAKAILYLINCATKAHRAEHKSMLYLQNYNH